MRGINWLSILIGWLIGSFFGVGSVLGMFGSLSKPKTAPAAA